MIKFIVTDPCYILRDEWDICCKELDGKYDQYKRFDEAVQKELRKLSGSDRAWAGSTGIGDWSNSISEINYSDRVKINSREFAADAGMVCVVERTDVITSRLRDEGWLNENDELLDTQSCVAEFEICDDDDDIEVDIDNSDKNWTVVRVSLNNEEVVVSESSENEYYGDEDDESNYDEDEEDDEWN